MIREIKYTVLDDSGTQKISPSTKQWAGMQYENNATKVSFDITALVAKIEKPLCRIDFNSSSAGYDPNSASVPEYTEGKYIISREIPIKYTQYGGEMQITAVVINTKDESNTVKDTDMVAYSFPVTVNFTAVKKDSFSQTEIVKNISALEQEVKETAENAETAIEKTKNTALGEIAEEKSKVTKAATIAITSAANAEKYANEVEDIKAELETELGTAPKIFKSTEISVDSITQDGIVSIVPSSDSDLYSAKVGDVNINAYVFKLINIKQSDNTQYWSCLDYANQTFDPESKNAQSGIAVEEAFKSKKADTLMTDETELEGKYPTALAAKEYTDNVGSFAHSETQRLEQMAISLAQSKADKTELENKADKSQIGEIETALGNKVDKEDGKTLYRGMELINEYTFTGEETNNYVVFSQDLYGNSFNLDEVEIYVDLGEEVPFASLKIFSCYVNNYTVGEVLFYKGVSAASQNGRYFQGYAKRSAKNHWFTIGYNVLSTNGYSGEIRGSYFGGGIDYIYRLRVAMPIIKAGAKVSIYGRRVD